MRATTIALAGVLVGWAAATAAQPSGQPGRIPSDSVPIHEKTRRQWQVGYAEACITPPSGQAMMAGFGRERYAQGSIASLRAQALAFRDRRGKTALLIAADVLGFDRVAVDAMRHRIKAKHNIPPAAVCFSASHTHWGPAINYRTNFAIGGLNVWYIAFLEETLLALADRALRDLSETGIAYGACQVQIGMCRRLPNEKGGIGWGPYPEGSYDEHTPVLRITREKSPRQIVLVGHACHPTGVGQIGKWSPAYPGAMRQKLEATLEDCRAMFVMGCGGDAKVVYRDPESKKYVFAASPEKSSAGGVTLADAVLEFLKEGSLSGLRADLHTTLVSGSLSFQEPRSRDQIEEMAFTRNLRSTSAWWARQSLAYPDQRRQQRYEVQAWRLGDLTIVALEGEVCADWGGMTRALSATQHAMVIAYANHCAGYVPTARIIREGGYEGDTSHMAYFLPAPFQPKMEAELMQLLLQAVGRGGAVLAPGRYRDKNDLLKYIDASGDAHAITRADQWRIRRADILASVQSALGPAPGRSFRAPLDIKVIEEVELEAYTRKTISYDVDPYDRVESYLLVPHDLHGKSPAVLALHPTHPIGKEQPVGLGGNPQRHYAKELAERGYVVIAPDYWPMGHYRNKDYDPYENGYASGSMKGVWNHMRAIDVLQTLAEVDPERIGCIGHSLGGYNTVFLTAFDQRIKAMVSSAGFNSFFDYAASEYGGGDLANWALDKHIRRLGTVYGSDPNQVPFDFTELVGALAPRPFFISAPKHDHIFVMPGVTKCIEAARPVYELLN
ncbi:MAG: alpha/beta hydrolase, partial [Planctomycetota bacterium]